MSGGGGATKSKTKLLFSLWLLVYLWIRLFDFCLMSQIRKFWITKNLHPSFRYTPIFKYQNLDFKNPRFPDILLFDICLQWNSKLRCLKLEISKYPAKHQAFLISICIQIQKLRSFLRFLRWPSLVGSQISMLKHPFFYFTWKPGTRTSISDFILMSVVSYVKMTDDNVKSWKCQRRKIWQANSTGRIRLTLIILKSKIRIWL